jgi:hypothetical protein
MDTKMQLLINPTDISISQRQVRLKLYIQGNGLNVQSSDFIQGQRPIFINGGELQTLTNTDIGALFRLENLQGISPAQYANPLPDGMYNFCFEMYDFLTNQKISQKSCASLYLILNDPPLLNTPQKNEQIASTEFPNILFTWTPRQINATNISYKFELKQLIDPTLDPQIGFQMSPILYEETLFGTALLYNLSMPILTPGLRYAWRVKAISTTGLSENAVFKNDGYSEIYSFKYTASCAAPTFLLSESQSSKSVKITWEGIPEHTRYQVQYKKQDVRNAQWFSSNSLNKQTLITNLEPGVTYQFRVGSSCDPVSEGVQSFTYSGINTFTTPTETSGVPAYNCGIVPQINIQNQKPLTNLIQSETFKAGDFPVTILELQGENSPYSGKGYIIVPYLADTKIAVEFKDIVINTDYQLISGVVETSYNSDWKNVTDVEDFTGEGQGGQIEETVPFIIKDIVINTNGDILVNGVDGQQITIPGGKDTVITDSKGNTYNVDKDGNGSNVPVAAAEGGKPTPENTDGVDKNGQATAFTAKGISITFSGNGSKYAFDVMPDNASAALQKLYKKVGDVALPYKAVLNGDSDTLLGTVTVTGTNVKLDSIVFKTQNGAKIDFKRNDKVFVITVKGNLSYAEQQILATIKEGKKWKVIGAFMLVDISPKNVNVALVPTDEVSEKKLDQVIASTQEIYNKVGIKINFIKEKVLNINSVVSGNTIQTEKNTLTSTYSADQQSINSLYQSTESSYVLFVTDKTSSTGQQGYMRLNGQFGYVFKTGLDKTPAHELGHGIFKLEHPFEVYKTSESSTDLLMDYSSGTVLNHQDWKQINDPAFKLYAFQSQASGEQVDGARFILDADSKFITPNGELIALPKGAIINSYCIQINVNNSFSGNGFPNGVLYGFEINGKHYRMTRTLNIFNGYKDFENDVMYINSTSQKAGEQQISFLHFTDDPSKSHLVKHVVLDYKFVTSNDNKFAVVDYIGKITSGSILETIDFTGSNCGNDDIPKLVKGKNLVKNNKTPKNIKVDGKYDATITFNETTKKWKVDVKLDKNLKKSDLIKKGSIEDFEKQMSKLATEKVNELGGLNEKRSKPLFETTDDGGAFYVAEMNGSEWVSTICDLGSNVWENAALPENYWKQDDKGFEKSNIHLPPTLSGVSDGAIGIVSDYPQLIKLGYDVTTKEEVRKGIWTAVKNITPSSILDAASGAIKDKWDKYANSEPYITSHELGKDGVTVVSTLMGASFLKAGDDALEESVEKTGKEIASKVDDALIKGIDGADDVAKKNLKEALTHGEIPKEIVDELQDEINDTAVKKGKKLTWDELRALFKRGNDFNKKVVDLDPNPYQFHEVTVEQIIDGKIKKYRLDSYNEGFDIVSRKATDFNNIQPSTFENYCKELVKKYPEGTKITAPKYPKLNGKILKGKYKLEVPKTNSLSSNLNNFKEVAKKYNIEIVFQAE